MTNRAIFTNTLFVITILCTSSLFSKEQEDSVAAIKAADNARIAAMRSRDKEKLSAIFSQDLHYAHSTGVVDNKASFMEVLVSGRTKYLSFEYDQREIKVPAPGIATITGRARVKVETPTGTMENLLSFLAVWRLEEGTWRFLAWQSCKVPPATNP